MDELVGNMRGAGTFQIAESIACTIHTKDKRHAQQPCVRAYGTWHQTARQPNT